MLLGFRFPYSDKGNTPYDYIPMEGSKLRPDQKIEPKGMVLQDWADGIPDNAVIPSLAIWEKGRWCNELTEEQQAFFTPVRKQDRFNAYVVPGEGTPGNYLFRIFILHDDLAAIKDPPHPLRWPERLKKKKAWGGQTYSQGATHGYSYGFGNGVSTAPKPVTPPAPPPLPTSLRFRCTGCGHWFKENDLKSHKIHCCPGLNMDGTTDWVVMCECCRSLDDSSQVKPGYPKVQPAAEAEGDDKKEGTDGTDVSGGEESAEQPQ